MLFWNEKGRKEWKENRWKERSWLFCDFLLLFGPFNFYKLSIFNKIQLTWAKYQKISEIFNENYFKNRKTNLEILTNLKFSLNLIPSFLVHNFMLKYSGISLKDEQLKKSQKNQHSPSKIKDLMLLKCRKNIKNFLKKKKKQKHTGCFMFDIDWFIHVKWFLFSFSFHMKSIR